MSFLVNKHTRAYPHEYEMSGKVSCFRELRSEQRSIFLRNNENGKQRTRSPEVHYVPLQLIRKQDFEIVMILCSFSFLRYEEVVREEPSSLSLSLSPPLSFYGMNRGWNAKPKKVTLEARGLGGWKARRRNPMARPWRRMRRNIPSKTFHSTRE